MRYLDRRRGLPRVRYPDVDDRHPAFAPTLHRTRGEVNRADPPDETDCDFDGLVDAERQPKDHYEFYGVGMSGPLQTHLQGCP